MSTFSLSDEQTRQFHEQGFLGPFRLWDESETDGIKAMLEERFIDNLDSRIPYNNQFLTHAEFTELLKRPQLTDRMASIMGEDLFLWRVGCFNKPPNDPNPKEVPWHQDRNYWPLEPMMVCSARLAVDDVDLENSCMHVIPGTHREMVPHIPAREDQEFHEQADPEHYDESKAVPLILKSGEFVLFNERLMHWSAKNRSDRRRLGLAIRVLPPQVRVMSYDCEDHGLVQIRGGDPLTFNRLVVPPIY
jgi:ectoine hydroxylase-related dioxygenase (phytanoyl-CoA dioxygenase family)